MITVKVNGKPEWMEGPVPLVDYLGQLNLGERRIAIGYNGEVVHKGHWGDVVLQEGDVLDVVHMVGGGAHV